MSSIIGALQPGTTLQEGRYTIKKVLGQGATGITYLATTEQKLSGNLSGFSEKVQVAIKEFYFKEECQRNSVTQNVVIANTNYDAKVEQFKKSFVKEAKRIAGLSHPNIVHVLSIFEENGTVYYVMQYIRGGSIKNLIDEQGPIPEDRAVKWAIEVASALNYMHEKKMCHYDLKPGNIMLSEDDDAMLIDFGISKNYDDNGQETSTTPPGLTKGFAPLEQYTSVSEFSPLIDVYSLGATLYAMLTGTTPPEPMKWVDGHFTEKPQNVSDDLWNVVRKAMSLAGRDRPTMSELHTLLSICRGGGSGSAGGDETFYENGSGGSGGGYSGETIYAGGGSISDKPTDGDKEKDKEEEKDDTGEVETPKKSPYLFYILVGVLALVAAFAVFWFVGRGTGSTAPEEEPAEVVEVDTTNVTTIYDKNGEPVYTFSGEVVDNQPNGYGVLRYLKDNVRDRYEGHMVDGRREDNSAALFYKNGDIFRGAFKDDQFEIGTYYVEDSGEYFRGLFKNDKPWKGIWYNSHDYVISRVENGREK